MSKNYEETLKEVQEKLTHRNSQTGDLEFNEVECIKLLAYLLYEVRIQRDIEERRYY